MTLTDAKQLVLQECEREKKITTRNLIIVAVLAIIGVVLLAIFALPILGKMMNSAEGIPPQIKYILPIVVIASVYYPLMRARAIFGRKQKVEAFFSLVQAGKEVRFHHELETYLTVIPLGKIKYQLDPITRIYVSIDNQQYELPIQKYRAADLKRVLEQPQNMETYNEVMKELYNKTDETKATKITPEEKISLKPVEEFRSFAEKEFGTELAAMEKGRGVSKNTLYMQIAFAVALMGTIAYLVLSGTLSVGSSNYIFIILAIMIGGSFLWTMFTKRYMQSRLTGTTDFTQVKKKVFSKVVQYISPQFQYFENGHIGIAEFIDSLLFKFERYTLKGGDQIVGHYNGIPFQSCNLMVTFRPNMRNEKEGDDVVFYGNFFVARSPKTFEHPIVVRPVKGFFSDFNDNAISTYLNYGGERIRLEDPEFEKQFEVYCDDQITARYVLTPAFMQRLKKLNERHKGQVYFGINKNNIVIATNEGNSLMTVGNSPAAMLFQKIDLPMVESVYRELVEQLQMIDTLKLVDN